MGISMPPTTSDNCDYFFYLRLSPMRNPKVVNTRATSHTVEGSLRFIGLEFQ